MYVLFFPLCYSVVCGCAQVAVGSADLVKAVVSRGNTTELTNSQDWMSRPVAPLRATQETHRSPLFLNPDS